MKLRLISFGHTAFMAVGAYVSAWLTMPTALQRTALPNLPAWLAGHELAVPLALGIVLLAGLLLVWEGPALLASRWMPAALAAVHLITLGYLGQVMSGALLQLLPVVVGAPVPGVRWVGALTQAGLVLGALSLAWGLGGGGILALVMGAGASALARRMQTYRQSGRWLRSFRTEAASPAG